MTTRYFLRRATKATPDPSSSSTKATTRADSSSTTATTPANSPVTTLSQFCIISGELKNAVKNGKSSASKHIEASDFSVMALQTTNSNKKIAELLEEIEALLRDKSTITLNVTVGPNRSEYFPWTTDIEKTSIIELTGSIYVEYPEKEDVSPNTAAKKQETGVKESCYLGELDAESEDVFAYDLWRNIFNVQLYRKANIGKPVVSLEMPTKKFTDFTPTEVNSLYEISNLEAPGILDLPAFGEISSEALDSDLHKESLRKLLDGFDSRMEAIPSLSANETICSAYVCSFLIQAVLIFDGVLTLTPERALRGRRGHGKVDYSIEASVGARGFKKGVAQNIVQLESSLTARKRKSEEEEDDVLEDMLVPMKAYEIVTDAIHWYFLECSIDQSGDVPASDPNRPKFKTSKLDEMVNYRKSTWRSDAKAVCLAILYG
ncbi:hypothetical protein BGZ76_008038 [Entomortierella beljakovae]|nr:hypothetical protein BGZ76_008038 [Entomortierella beljakovae]